MSEPTLCDKCGIELQVGDFPFCPHGRGRYGVQDDSIPGGVLMTNGLCNPDGSPRRYDSHTEIRAEAKKRGLEQHVVHIGSKGSDKSKITTKWY
jgi:hypothetical protein